MDNQLSDEILSINAIYGDNTLSPISNEDSAIYILNIPGQTSISLRIGFPPSYPDTPPAILGTQTVGEGAAKGTGQHAVDISRAILGQVYQPGSPCIYDLMEELGSKFELLSSSRGEDHPQSTQGNGQHVEDGTGDFESDSHHQASDILDKEPPWVLSDVMTEKKSIFVARAAAVQSPFEAKAFLQHLLATDKKVAKATHNITAWRIHGPNETAFQDCDDDGETAAGGRLLHLMQLMDVWNVMVVVTRWYGGVQLGPDRFRIINSAARDAFVKGGFINDAKESKNDSGKKKGKK